MSHTMLVLIPEKCRNCQNRAQGNTDLFAGAFRDEWFQTGINTAQGFSRPFYFSELRMRLTGDGKNGTPSKYWWGTLGQLLASKGFAKTGNSRRNPIRVTRGAEDCEWVRVALTGASL